MAPPPPPPSRYKLTTYVSLYSACALGFLIFTSAIAQILPPLPSGIQWIGGNGSNWQTPENWNGGVPPDSANVLFGALADLTQTVVTDQERKLRSLWFEAGTFYTLEGTGSILLSQASNGYLVVVTSDGTKQSEHNIELDVKFDSLPNPAYIRNYSEGGLRFGKQFYLSDNNIRFSGSGAIHLAGQITGQNGNRANGNIRVEGFLSDGSQPHLILSGNNNWGGNLDVYDRGFVILKRENALGDGTNKTVHEGGTLALRSHHETPLTYGRPTQNIYINTFGDGIVRAEGTQRIGSIYNDGGSNLFDIRINQTTQQNPIPTGFGSRGDRGGGLELSHQVRLTTAFHKLGPGLIVLSNTETESEANQWDKDTVLKAGVLRLANSSVLPTDSNLVFAGGIFGGILELGYDGFSRGLGTGNNQMRWMGDGGFSAYGGSRSVTIGNDDDVLVWGGTEYFIGDGHALLLSSRYANHIITFENAINLGSDPAKLREVRVERGEQNAHAELSGVLSGAGGGLLKTGDGLLRLSNLDNTYTGATRIEGGALLGAVENTASNIVLAGGVLGINADFTRGLGQNGNQIQWNGSGGFAAYGNADRSVNIGGLGETLTWGNGGFVGDDQELRFGHYTANRTVLWDNALALGDGERIIRIERGTQLSLTPVVEFREAISGTGTLNLVGRGRSDFIANNSALSGAINIYGAELRLHGTGKLNEVTAFDIRHGGRLILNNTEGNTHGDRLKSDAKLTLAAGTLRLDSDAASVSQKVGELTLEAGANTVELRSSDGNTAQLHIEKLNHSTNSRATLHLFGEFGGSPISFKLSESAAGYAVGGDEDGNGDKIIPWATNGINWLIAETENSNDHFLKPLVTYFDATQAQDLWKPHHNVRVNDFDTITLTKDHVINSLVLRGTLDFNAHRLEINSGGFMTYNESSLSTVLNSGPGSHITTGTISATFLYPLYIHSWNHFDINGDVRIWGGMDVIKSKPGRFTLNSSANHEIGSLYVHEGTFYLSKGTLTIVADRRGIHYRVIIGDGAGTDKLILPGGRWDPIKKSGPGNPLPSITLRGTPYDPRGPEYGGDQAILQLGGNGPAYGAGTKQHLAELRIEGRGTIDFRGGDGGEANILWIEELIFSSTSDRLFIRNWYEYEDLLLVRRTYIDGLEGSDRAQLLRQIVFEGYQDYQTTLKDYDANYWQVYPFGRLVPFPEPSTYGAILGSVGIGLWGWRKRTQRLGLRPRRCAQNGSGH